MLAPQPLSPQVAAFFAQYERTDGKFELVAGRVIDRRGGSAGHAGVVGNILVGLTARLRGTGLRTFNGQMGLSIDTATVFYPDIAIYGDRRDLDLPGETQLYRYPKLVVEVTSPATRAADHGYKLAAYKARDTIAAIVLVDPISQTLELHERVAPNEWRHVLLPPESGLTLRDPALDLPFHEIFASD